MISHDKPDQVCNAIDSVLSQMTDDWELIVIDSGILLDKGHFECYNDKRITFHFSGETKKIRDTKAIAPWCFNECFRRKLVHGDLIVYLCDDDIFYPNAFSLFQRWAKNNPNVLAFYASEDVAVNFPLGNITIVGERKALEIGGRGAYRMSCRVDYLQLCHRVEILKHFEDEYWPESKETEKFADGIFMEKIGQISYIYPIPVKIGQNRRCENSTNAPLN
jgi:glycosyltransferase involved in cell wall biosynthesis